MPQPTTTNPANLETTSPFWRKIFGHNVSAQGGNWGEANPLAQFSARVSQLGGTNNRPEGTFADAAVTQAMIPGANITIYVDVRDQMNSVVNDTGSEDAVSRVKRSSLTFACGLISQNNGFLLPQQWSDRKLAVSEAANLTYRLGKVVSALKGEFSLAALCSRRGEENVMELADALDAPGDDEAAVINSELMQKLNYLQSYAGGTEKVRSPTNVFTSWLKSKNPIHMDDVNYTLATDTANSRLRREDLGNVITWITKSGNRGRNDFPFRRCMMRGSIMADGERKRSAGAETLVFLSNHENVHELSYNEDWADNQMNLANRMGNMDGLRHHLCGEYKGSVVYGFDKMPIYTRNAVRIATTFCLGRGALVELSNPMQVDPASDGLYSGVKNATLRTFMETKTPVKVNVYPLAKRGNTCGTAVEFQYGAVCPAFADKDGVKKDYGRAVVLSTLSD